jgi:hypothetical protein
MKTLNQIREASGGKEAYMKFFNSLLKKHGVSSPSELKGDKKKAFFNALDKGWESDDPNDKNEKYEDPDNLDPDTTVDSDEDLADKAVSQVTEKTKLKAGKGKITVDLNWDGSARDKKFAETKYKIKIKPNRYGAIISGDKAKVLAYVSGQDYDMDDADIEDLMPELMQDYHESYDEMKEGKNYPVMDQGQRAKIIKIAKANSGNMAKAIKLIDKIRKGLSDNPDVMDLLKKANETYEVGTDKYKKHAKKVTPGEKESVDEANRFSKKLKGDAKSLWQRVVVYKQSGKAKHTHGDKEWDAVVDKMAKDTKVSPKDIAAVKQAVQHEGVSEGVAVDRRTVGFKAALVRNEKAKKVREKSKLKKEKKKEQEVLDARYDYDGGVDVVLAAANKSIFGETAANSVASGNVDMAPNAGKKKKKSLKVIRRDTY